MILKNLAVELNKKHGKKYESLKKVYIYTGLLNTNCSIGKVTSPPPSERW